jgi:DNA-binding LacI/PurR family transcriptional regulator
MADAGVAAPRFVTADFTVEARRRSRELLSGPDAPTAIFAASDEMAFGVLAAARELGIEVPGRLSVIGVDGTSWRNCSS